MNATLSLDRLADGLKSRGELRRDEPLARHTTFGIGGPADLFFRATGAEAVVHAARAARSLDVPCTILGSGSNVLVGDRGIRGLVIENEARTVAAAQPDGARVRVRGESGASFATTARRLCRSGYWGLEWAVGIPGTLGGAVVYNAGAYGGCLADVLVSIQVLEPDGSIHEIAAPELQLEYRGSVFTRGLLRDRVILSVEFVLRPGDPATILAHITGLDAKRLATQPRGRNAGSIFKNPPSQPAWRLIDQVGLRGASHGGAQISDKHANFFTNTGGATAADVRYLMELATSRVRDQFDVELHPEVALVGEGF